MIVKLMKGEYILSVEADCVLQQQTESGCVDLEICKNGTTIRRVLIGETSPENAASVGQANRSESVLGVETGKLVVADFCKAYLVENGKTVDCISRKYRNPFRRPLHGIRQ